MKKTKLLTSLVALALVVGLGACETGDIIVNVGDVDIGGDSSDTTDTEPSEPSEPSSSDTGSTPSEPGDDSSSSSSTPEEPPVVTHDYSIEVENGDSLTLTYDEALETQQGVDLSIKLVTTSSTGDETKEDASADNLTFTVSDPTVVSVSGLTVLPLKEGSTSITIAWADKATTSVDVEVSDVTITYTYSLEVENGNSLTLTYDEALETQQGVELSIKLVTTSSTGDVTKEDATADNLTFTVSDPTIVTVSGLTVTPLSGGETSITIKWSEHDEATASVGVTVTDVTESAPEFDATIYEADERYHIYPDGKVEVHQVEYDVESGTSETGHCVVCGATGLYTNMMSFTANGDGTCTMTSFTSTSATTVYVPKTYNGMTVTGVGDNSKSSGSTGVGFYGRTSLTFVGLPNTITEIQKYAFGGCTNLVTVNLPEGLTSIANRGFYNCQNLELPTFPSTLLTIGNEAFYQCSKFIEVTIPDTVTSLGEKAFQACKGLVKAHIPENIESVGDDLFYQCTVLTSVNIPAKETIPVGYLNGCSIIESSGIELPTGVTITAVGKNAFKDCKAITSLDFLPNTITSFGDYAFQNVPITEIDFTKFPNVTSFGSYALGGTSLVKVDFPSTVTELGTWLFSSCTTLEECSLPTGLSAIPQRLFSGCTGLTTVTIPSSVTSVAAYAFYNCNNLTTVYFDGDKTQWELLIVSAMESGNNTPLTNIAVPNYTGEYNPDEDETSYEAQIYEDDDRYHVYADGTIEPHQVTFYEGTTYAGYCQVCGASLLNTANVTYTLEDDEQSYRANTYSGSATSVYIATEYEGIPVTAVGNPSATSTSNAQGFYNKSSLEFVGLPTSVDTVYPYCFYSCKALAHLDFAGPVNLGKAALRDCQALTGTIDIAEGQTIVDGYTFYDCYGLTQINLPNTVEQLGDQSFYKCTSLKSFSMPDSVTTIASSDTFSSCTALEYLKVSANAASLPNRFASSCTALTTLVIPSGTTTINTGAFTGDSALTTVYYGGTASQWATATSDVTILSDLTPIYYNGEGEEGEVEEGNYSSSTFVDGEGTASVYENDTHYHLYENGVLEPHQAGEDGVCTVCGQTGLNVDGLTYELNTDEESYYVASYSGSNEVYIPSTYNGLPVTSISYVGASNGTKSGFSVSGGTGVEFVGIPSSVTIIGDHAFRTCTSLETLILPKGVVDIGDRAFQGATGLKYLDIPEGCTHVGEYQFYGDSALEYIVIPDSVTSLEDRPFQNCTSLRYAILGHGIESVPTYSFYGCSILTDIVLPNTITSVKASAFSGLEKLENIYFDGTEEQWATILANVNSTGNSNLTDGNYNLIYYTNN